MKQNKKPRVLVAMSGGVDSSTTASLLLDRGYEVAGTFMDLGQVNAKRDIAAATNVAKKLGIPFEVTDFKKIFKKEIINYFIHEYSIGNTPNPCAVCNKKIKMGLLFDKMKKNGFDYLATGHYIKLKKVKDKYKLLEAKDENKDQSYFLYSLTQKQLKHLIFPMENFIKKEVQAIAKEKELPNLPMESQDICFLAKLDHNVYLKEHLKLKKGAIVDMDGKKIGEHQGLPLYTIGQRRLINIGGSGPYYAAKIDYKTNTLSVTNDPNDKTLYSKKIIAKNVNWLSGEKPNFPFKCKARIRYRQEKKNCTVTQEKGKYVITFTKPERAVAKGQSIVFYTGKELLGGGTIVKSIIS